MFFERNTKAEALASELHFLSTLLSAASQSLLCQDPDNALAIARQCQSHFEELLNLVRCLDAGAERVMLIEELRAKVKQFVGLVGALEAHAGRET